MSVAKPLNDHVTALILAGGQGKRMGGQDKGLMDWQGQTLIQTQINTFSAHFAQIVINANRNIEVYQQFNYPVISDKITGFAGPLAGIHAGLRHITTGYTFVMPCDAPHINMAVFQRMAKQLANSDKYLAVARVNGRLEPVVLLLKTSLVDSIDTFLQSGQRKAADWIIAQTHVIVDFSDLAACFANINTPTDQGK